MGLLRTIVRFFDPVQDVRHPFTYSAPTTEPTPEKKKAPSIKKTTWGKAKNVEVVFREDDEYADASWALPECDDDMKEQELPPLALDDFDKEVIKETGVDIVGYRRLKPYVLAGWTYPETTKVINFSVRWMQERGPKIKEAERRRKAAK
jgi:hypothetical protein